MERRWPPQAKLKRGAWLGLVVTLGLATMLASLPKHIESLRGLATALAGVWRASGNAILTLDSNIKQGVTKGIDFTNEPYPPNNTADETFYTRARINGFMGGTANLQSFTLLCGLNTTTSETSRVTDIVFWTQDYWEGTNQRFSCGPSSSPSYEVLGAINNVGSFCLVTDKTPSSARRLRCISGPRCDDHWKNGNESDVDCGGSCRPCGVNRMCNSGNDCASGSCIVSGGYGLCRDPTCDDGVRNGNETDVDCGGSCSKCINGKTCSADRDCQSGGCQNGVCQVRYTCSGAVATSSAQNYTVLVDFPNFCGGWWNYFANNLNEAKSCASGAGWSVPSQMCNYDLLMETNPNWYHTVVASSPNNAVMCAKNTVCSNCNPQVVNTYGCVLQ